MELINVMTRLEQEYTEVSLNVTIQMCINHRIDFSSVHSFHKGSADPLDDMRPP